MKTAISIPDHVFEEAETLAKKLRITRSKLYTQAILEYLKVHHPNIITEKLNQLYSQENSNLDPAILSLQLQSLDKEIW